MYLLYIFHFYYFGPLKVILITKILFIQILNLVHLNIQKKYTVKMWANRSLYRIHYRSTLLNSNKKKIKKLEFE
jgi:hypothetical protein